MDKQAPSLETLYQRRDEILALADRYGVHNIRIVGSVARQEVTGSSDLDLLLTIPDDWDVFDLVDLWQDLESLLDCHVSLIPDDTSDQDYLKSALVDAVPL